MTTRLKTFSVLSGTVLVAIALALSQIIPDRCTPQTYKIGSHYLEAIVLTPSPLVIHRDVFTFDVTAFIQSLEEPGHVHCVSGR